MATKRLRLPKVFSTGVLAMLLITVLSGAAQAGPVSLCSVTGTTNINSGSTNVAAGGLGTLTNALGTATATANSDSATAAPGGSIVALTNYCFAVAGPSATVLVDVSGLLTTDVSNSQSLAEALIYFTPISLGPPWAGDPLISTVSSADTGDVQTTDADALCPGLDCTTLINPDPQVGSYYLPTNTLIELTLQAYAVGAAGGTASASVDPYISVDSSNANADLFSVAVSGGVNNAPETPSAVPEPATLVLLGTGLAGAYRWRRRTNRGQ